MKLILTAVAAAFLGVNASPTFAQGITVDLPGSASDVVFDVKRVTGVSSDGTFHGTGGTVNGKATESERSIFIRPIEPNFEFCQKAALIAFSSGSAFTVLKRGGDFLCKLHN